MVRWVSEALNGGGSIQYRVSGTRGESSKGSERMPNIGTNQLGPRSGQHSDHNTCPKVSIHARRVNVSLKELVGGGNALETTHNLP